MTINGAEDGGKAQQKEWKEGESISNIAMTCSFRLALGAALT